MTSHGMNIGLVLELSKPVLQDADTLQQRGTRRTWYV